MALDFRSDTVTKPSPPMLQAMMEARIGDDVFGEDPSINELEMVVAAMLGGTVGSYLGSRQFSPSLIKKLLAVVLTIAGVKLIFA